MRRSVLRRRGSAAMAIRAEEIDDRTGCCRHRSRSAPGRPPPGRRPRRLRRALPPLPRSSGRLLPPPRRRPSRRRGAGPGGLRPGPPGHARLRRRASLLPVDDRHRPAAVHRPPPAQRRGSSRPPRSIRAPSIPSTTSSGRRSTGATSTAPSSASPRGTARSSSSVSNGAGPTSRSPITSTCRSPPSRRSCTGPARPFDASTSPSPARTPPVAWSPSAGSPPSRCGPRAGWPPSAPSA